MTKSALASIDRVALGVIFSLGLILTALIWLGQTCSTTCFAGLRPQVKNFSWQGQHLGSSDRAFILTFDRPMDIASVEKNLRLIPPLPGKISWAGKRLAYTLSNPIPYGESYQLQLENARAQANFSNSSPPLIKPFLANFSSRDRAFAYIATEKANQGQLILHNFTQQQTQVLTPPNLVVFDFKFYPQGEKILFSAAPKSRGIEGIRELELYTVTTGLNTDSSPVITKILDSKTYQNNQFDLAADGETIVISRIHRHNPKDFGLWLLKPGAAPRNLNLQGGEFLIAPDSQTLAVAQGEGIGFVPIHGEAQTLDFLPKYGRILGFSADGTAAAMVNFNTDNAKLRYTKTLVYVNNQDQQKNLLNLQGSIIDCKFNPTATHLYCLLTELVTDTDIYKEIPYFAKININNAQVTPLLQLPDYRDIKISLSADGLAILFDQVITTSESLRDQVLSTDSGEAIIGGRLWLLFPPINDKNKTEKPVLEELPLVGFRPQWAP